MNAVSGAIRATPLLHAQMKMVDTHAFAQKDTVATGSLVQVFIITKNVLDLFLLILIVETNECATAAHNCHPAASCQNSVGSFTCACTDGHTGDGIICEGNNTI